MLPEHLCGRQEFSSLPSANTNSLENRYNMVCKVLSFDYVDDLPTLLFLVQQVDLGMRITSKWFRSQQPANLPIQAGLLKVVSDVASQAVKEAVEEDKASNQSKAVCRW